MNNTITYYYQLLIFQKKNLDNWIYLDNKIYIIIILFKFYINFSI